MKTPPRLRLLQILFLATQVLHADALRADWQVLDRLPELYALELLPDGRILGSARTLDRLLLLDSLGRKIGGAGGPGSGSLGYFEPSETDGRLGLSVLLADRQNRRICRLDRELAYQGSLELEAAASPDCERPDLLAISATQAVVVADREAGGVLLLETLGERWRTLYDYPRGGGAPGFRALEVLGETVYLLESAGDSPAALWTLGTEGGLCERIEMPGLLALHRDARDTRLLLLSEAGEEIRISELGQEPGAPHPPGPGKIMHTLSRPPCRPRDFLLLKTGLLLACENGPPCLFLLEAGESAPAPLEWDPRP